MPLESATYIAQLVATNPAAGDAVSVGDDHLRLIKSVLQTQFPNLGAVALASSAAAIDSAVSQGTILTTNAVRGATVAASGTQSVNNSTNTRLSFDVEGYDTDAVHDISLPTRLTVPGGVSYIQLWGQAMVQGNIAANCVAGLSIYVSGTYYGYETQQTFNASTSGVCRMQVSTPIVSVSPGQYFELNFFQTSGGTVTMDSSNRCAFAMRIIK